MSPPFSTELHSQAERIIAGDRRALAKAVTLVESNRADHREQAENLITLLMDKTGRSLRIGLSGVPGVGKSTFIEAFGTYITSLGHRIAVLAVDPSSKRNGGSILGDKTRMELLSRNPDAFIRPSPAGETLGGVTRRTREAMLLCEAAGYDIILIETVGVGQSETAVSEMTDLFTLMLLPSGGDELQGLKKGIVELADIVLVNKADGPLREQALGTVSEYHGALRLMGGRDSRRGWQVPIQACSAFEGKGIHEVWDQICAFRQEAVASGRLESKRASQAQAWLQDEIIAELTAKFRKNAIMQKHFKAVQDRVLNGSLPAPAAARLLIENLKDS